MSSAQKYFNVAGAEIWLFTELSKGFPAHFHNAVLCGQVLRGERIFCYGNQERLLRKGDTVILPPGLTHSCRQAGEEKTVWISLHISGYTGNFEPAFPEQGLIPSALSRLGLQLLASKKPPIEIVRSIKQSVCTSCKPVRNPMAAKSQFTGLLEVANERPGLEGLARRAGINKFSFLRNFSKTMGLTPHRYLASLRLEKAQLLLQSGASLTDCALDTGYYDQSHFCRSFKSILGVTPGAYRSEWQDQIC